MAHDESMAIGALDLAKRYNAITKSQDIDTREADSTIAYMDNFAREYRVRMHGANGEAILRILTAGAGIMAIAALAGSMQSEDLQLSRAERERRAAIEWQIVHDIWERNRARP